jgi:predicted nucleic acid-binding protein
LLECTVLGKPGADRLGEYLAGKVEEIDLAGFVITSTGLGRGELETMALYKRWQADRLLMDDQRARKLAALNGVAVMGSVGVLLFAKSKGHIHDIRSSLVAIKRAGIFIGEGLFIEALRMAGE